MPGFDLRGSFPWVIQIRLKSSKKKTKSITFGFAALRLIINLVTHAVVMGILIQLAE